MPRGETCVTALDMLKRPKSMASTRADARAALRAAAAVDTPDTAWNFTVIVVVLCSLGAMVAFRQRLYDDGRDLLSPCEPMCPDMYAQAAPLAEQSMAALDAAVERGAEVATEMSNMVRDSVMGSATRGYGATTAADSA